MSARKPGVLGYAPIPYSQTDLMGWNGWDALVPGPVIMTTYTHSVAKGVAIRCSRLRPLKNDISHFLSFTPPLLSDFLTTLCSARGPVLHTATSIPSSESNKPGPSFESNIYIERELSFSSAAGSILFRCWQLAQPKSRHLPQVSPRPEPLSVILHHDKSTPPPPLPPPSLHGPRIRATQDIVRGSLGNTPSPGSDTTTIARRADSLVNNNSLSTLRGPHGPRRREGSSAT